MNKVVKIISILIIVGAIGFAGYKLLTDEDKGDGAEIVKAETDEGESSNREAPLPVKVISVEKGKLPLRLRVSATADVWEKAVLKSEVRGNIQKIHASVGDFVRKGQLLLKLDDRELKLELEKAKTAKLKALSDFLVKEDTNMAISQELSPEKKRDLEAIKEKYLKSLDLYSKGKLKEAEFEKISDEYEKSMVFSGELREEIRKAQEGLSNATLTVKQKDLDIKRTFIRAPFDGIVADISVSTGEKINQGQDLLKIVNLDSLYLRGYALESEIRHLSVGTQVRVRFDSFPDKFFFGTLKAISPEIDPDKKTITIFIDIDNKKRQILPGMHAEIDIEYKVFEDVVKVPIKAVVSRQERTLVFKVEGNIALWTYVDVGAKNDEDWQILSGLEGGEQVVVEGHLTLAHQSRVKVVK
jgi:RND family efflux transporter MFP subunit